MRAYVLMLMLFILSGCRKYEDGFGVYKIKEGKHYSTRGVEFIRTEDLSFYAKFDQSAIYQTVDPINQLDINKLYGFSECNDHHQDNSARFGWRYYQGELQIFAYVYNNGIVTKKYMGDVDIGLEHYYSIDVEKDYYYFTLDGNTKSVARTSNCESGFYYKLYPYFGGDETAPHDIIIMIKEIR